MKRNYTKIPERTERAFVGRNSPGSPALFASLLSLLFFVSLASGCGAARPNQYYQLTVPGSFAPAPNPNAVPVTLLIGRISGPAIYREDQIVYSGGGEGMGLYEYHRWVEPPTEMVQEILLRQFRASGDFRGVYALRSDAQGDYLLHGRLYDFKEVSGSPLSGRVSIELELRNVKTHAVVWTHYYSHDEPASEKSVGAVVSALDKNLHQGVEEALAGVKQYFETHPPAPAAPSAP
ncbi:MAG TPA: ABC-type transport auxiliary lipoprotein family protein [Candidatus Acidoferrum sp.]|nr:ABC-type transport auxiliary lipoprotein family protein [Candidatus Acidoferrum sp.]